MESNITGHSVILENTAWTGEFMYNQIKYGKKYYDDWIGKDIESSSQGCTQKKLP